MAIYLIGLRTLLGVKDVTILSNIKTISVVVAGVFVTIIEHKSDLLRLLVVINFVICIVETPTAAMWAWSRFNFWLNGLAETDLSRECGAFSFDFEGLTIGQAVSASSAAAGAGSARIWVQNILELGRVKIAHLMGGLHCQVSPTIVSKVFNQKRITDEFLSLLGCTDELSGETAARWSEWLRELAVKMKLTSSAGQSRMGHMVIDAVRHDHALHVVYGLVSYTLHTSHVLTQNSLSPKMN